MTLPRHYFIGNDSKKWRTDISTYGKVKYHGVYEGIDLVYYGNQGKLEYDFVVSPGADPSAIKIAFEGADKIDTDREGNLVLRVAGGEVRIPKPLVYQEVDGVRKEVIAAFVFNPKSKVVGFEIAKYDGSKPLVIDPVLVFSTYLGGGGKDFSSGIALDATGSIWVAGATASTNFPTANSVRSAYGGGNLDAFLTKFTPDGTSVLYSTYMGGGEQDAAVSLAVDWLGNAYLIGDTSTTNFPVTPNAFQTAYGGGEPDMFVAKIDPSRAGTASLVYSTFLGGSIEDHGAGIAVDSSGNIYVSGRSNSGNFPTTAGAFRTTISGPGNADVVVAKIDPSRAGVSSLVYSTYIGGSAGDAGNNIAVDGLGSAYVTGSTHSTDFPTVNAFQSAHGGGGTDVFVAKLNSTGSALLYSTYLGGSGDEEGWLTLDLAGNVYLVGNTSSANFPTTPGAFQTIRRGSVDAFVAKIDPSQTGIQLLIWSTYLGGSADEPENFGIAVDSSGNVYVTGGTTSSDFPIVNGLQTTKSANEDAYVAKLNSTGSSLLFSTYFGGNGDDGGTGIAVDPSGNIYVSGKTSSTNLITTPGVFQVNYGGGVVDAFVVKINLISVLADAGADQTVIDGAFVSLNGTASTGQNLTYQWQQLPGGPVVTLNNSTSATPTFTAPLLPGGFGSQVLTFKLTVTSGSQSSAAVVNVTVINVNHAPEAHVGADQVVNEGSFVSLDGSASFDPDNDPIGYQWVQTSGQAIVLSGANTATPTFNAPFIAGGLAGPLSLTFSLTVSDGALTATTESTVAVVNVNHAPIADAGAPQTVHSGRLVTLSGNSSYDPDNDPIAYQWTQVSGPAVTLSNAASASPSFTAPPTSGTTTLKFRLTVSDSLLSSSPANVEVTVKNGPPLCNLASASPNILWPPNHGMIPISIQGVTDPDDGSVAITIQSVTQDEPVNGIGDGDTSPDAVIVGSAVLIRAERSGAGNGRVYRINFTANDGQGGSCSSFVKVAVPHSMKPGSSAVDDGQLYNSTLP